MAFHVACPITCRKICFCALGLPAKLQNEKAKTKFLEEVARVEQFLDDPWLIKARENATIQVKVPKVVVSPDPPPQPTQLPEKASVTAGCGEEEAAVVAASSHVKRVALQKQAAAASVVAEDYARRFGSGDMVTSLKDTVGEEQGQSNSKVTCLLCFSGKHGGSERARKMLSCNSCGKKYHRSCLKAWSRNRDLFHWSSWTCPSCRTCEVCRRTGDPSKFTFCKRCDGAYHCYCQQPPHKNVSHGPYLCPKHTKCHSCGSSVPGHGLSVRWFLGYTCCDACGRLFVKGNYCPVCLKVYRDSESTPMVCCDICERWVHCPCDGISDAKYMQFQVDGNLQYVCPTCRGECRQVRNLEEAVQELWRRRDESDKDLISSLRAAAGLPTQEEIFDISPFSDDEESGPLSMKNDYGRSLKFSLKRLGEKSPSKSKLYGQKLSDKKYGKKKGIGTSSISRADAYQNFGGHTGGPLFSSGDNKNEEMQFSGEPVTLSPAAGSLAEGLCSVNEAAISKHKYIDEIAANNATKTSRTFKIKSNKSHGLPSMEDTVTNSSVQKTAHAPKLVIHLGGRNRNTTSPLRSESSSFKAGHILASASGNEDMNQLKHHEYIDRPQTAANFGGKNDIADQVRASKLRGKEGQLLKLKNAYSEPSCVSSKPTGDQSTHGHVSIPPKNTYSGLGKGGAEDSAYVRSGSEVQVNSIMPFVSQAKDQKPYLKFKIPNNTNNGNQNAPSNSNAGNHSPLPLAGKNEITYTRGQRSKRRRPTPGDEDASEWGEDSSMKEIMDANWILQKLGKDAAGKRVEVHQPSDNSWHRGTVKEVVEGTSIVSIAHDDGNAKSYELGKQGIRFIAQKAKH